MYDYLITDLAKKRLNDLHERFENKVIGIAKDFIQDGFIGEVPIPIIDDDDICRAYDFLMGTKKDV